MFPEHSQPPRREPAFNAPAVIVVLLALLAAVHVLRLVLPVEDDLDLMFEFAFVPARLTVWLDPARLETVLTDAGALGPGRLALAQYALSFGNTWWSLLTHAFLHGSWMHLGLNGLWLLAFGAPVARRFGVVRFLILFVICAVAGALFYGLMRPDDVTPMIGASGAISGIMAAAARFVFSDRGPVVFGHAPRAMLYAPARPLIEVMANRQAATFILIWFAINLMSGAVAGAFGVTDGAVAWEAHMGGFLAGLALFVPLDPIGVGGSRTRR